MSTDALLRSDADGIATLTLNRPDKRNAMSDAMRTALIEALEDIAVDKSVRALVLTGAGKGFCAGGDLARMKERMDAPPGEIGFNAWTRHLRISHAQVLLHTMPKPTIAAVNGPAAGLGADTALACDFVIAVPEARFVWSYVLRGLTPDGGGLHFLPRRVGLARAKELIFTGRPVACEEAVRLGIIDRMSTAETLLADAQAWAKELSASSMTAIALSKTLLNQSFETTIERTLASGNQAQGICYTSTEHQEAVRAFLAGRGA